MDRQETSPRSDFVLAGWQGVTVEIPQDWNISAISGDEKAGYIRFDDEAMPRLEIKWASESGFVDLNKVIDKYLGDVQKARKKGASEVKVDRDIKLVSKRKRKKSGLKCFHWQAEVGGYGAAWVCKDCGRTMIAQMMTPDEEKREAAQELAASILLSIEDHPRDDWVLWSAYGFACQAPKDFKLAGPRLMAGLIEFEFERDTEKIKLARWGMANVALKKKTLQEWVGSEMAKTMRKHNATPEEMEIKGHEGLRITGENTAGAQKLQRFFQHCAGKLYADRLIGRAWHCEPTNKIFYVETVVDRENEGLADELAARIECHRGVNDGAEEE